MPTHRFEDRRFPPRNREYDQLPVLHLRIVDADTEHQLDPNGAIIASVQGTLPVTGPAIAKSVLSGAPALIWREDDLGIPLTGDEIHRLIQHRLTPDEYFRLRERYGLFFSIHTDFFAPDTGEALQPVG